MTRSNLTLLTSAVIALAVGGVAYASPKAREVVTNWLFITADKHGILAVSATPTNFGMQLQLGDGRTVYASGQFLCVQLQRGDDVNQVMQTFGASSAVQGSQDASSCVSPERSDCREIETHRPSRRGGSGAEKGVEIGLRVLSEVLNR